MGLVTYFSPFFLNSVVLVYHRYTWKSTPKATLKTHLVQISQRNLRTCFFYYIVLLSKPAKSCPKPPKICPDFVQTPKMLSSTRPVCLFDNSPQIALKHYNHKGLRPQNPKTTSGQPLDNAGQIQWIFCEYWTNFYWCDLGTPNISHRILRISHLILIFAGQNHNIWTKSGQNKNTLSCEILKQNARVSTL